ncbi:MAG: DUF5000 domain-containing lipoprotein, partial [Bacteroidota bacterium]
SILALAGGSCKRDDGSNFPVSADKTKPGVVTNVKVTNYNGGAYITYDLPNSPNILYVLAKYTIRDGVPREAQASYFSDTLKVEVFARAQAYQVTLYTVTRANVLSDPLVVTVNPDTPAYLLVRKHISMQTDFGGVNIRTFNRYQQQVGIIFTAIDPSTHQLEVQDQHYTNQDSISYSLRGYNSTSQQFGVYVTDNFGNSSDTLIQNITPLFEELLDKSQFSVYQLLSDTPIGFGWVLPNLWDGKTDGSSNGWHTNPGNTAPFLCTFNVGQSYKLSRFVLWERPDNFAFTYRNPKIFTIWGSNASQPKDATMPLSSSEGAVVGDWTNLGNFTYPNPPSGLPAGATNSSDNAFVLAGVNFNFPLSDPPIHFIRIAVAQTWANTDFTHLMEISLYGQSQ